MSIVDKYIGQHVVVRTTSAGVHLGTLAEVEGSTLVLTGARRLWRWIGAFTLSEVATAGIRPKGSRIAVSVPEIVLLGVIEIIPTSTKARETFDATHE